MELPQFEGQSRNELAMIDVAHAVLEVKGEILHFNDLLSEVADYLGLSDSQVEEAMTQFYTDLNIDGGFISLGENRWGLREWYPVDSIDEEITHDNDAEDERPRRRKKKRKALDEDYEEDFDEEEFDEDEEDEDEEEEEDDDIDYGQKVAVDDHGVMTDEEDKEDLGEYQEDLSELETDEEEEELDEDFSELDDDEDEEEEDEEEF